MAPGPDPTADDPDDVDISALMMAGEIGFTFDARKNNLRLAAEVQYVNAQINVIYNYCKLLYETGTLNAER